MRRLQILLLGVAVAAAARGADPWHSDFYNAMGDTWRARIAVDLSNEGADDLAGFPVVVPVGQGGIGLVGANARDLRVCDRAGTEMLFDLAGPDDGRLDDGPIPAGARLALPLTAAAGATQRLYVYYDHPGSYPVPDFLASAFGAQNTGFEEGRGEVPTGWSFDAGDPSHVMQWVDEHPHDGRRCVKTVVKPGAEPTWIAARQRDLAVIPGARYRLTAWVKGDNVVGYAGWYVHVATPDNPMKVGQIEQAGDGTFDWKHIRLEFTAPEGAVSMSHGTVLRGTGTAWFDGVELEALTRPAVRYEVGATERLELAEVGGAVGELRQGGKSWECSVPIRVINTGEALKKAVVQTSATRLLTLLRRGYSPASLRVVDRGVVIPFLLAGDDILFVADVPARSVKTFDVFFSANPGIPAGAKLSYGDLVSHLGNLAANPSFEEGDERPTSWPGSTEGQEDPNRVLRRAEGGLFGDYCARMEIRPAAPTAWVGWRQEVAVEPGASYFVGAWLRSQGVEDGTVKIHGHFHDAGGQLTGQRYWSSPTGIAVDSDWTLAAGVATMSAGTVEFTVHLTMNAHGTVEHDGVVMMRTTIGSLGDLRTTKPGGPALRVWDENPIVKVFRDTPPRPTPERIELAAARGEEECLQLCLRAERDIEEVRIGVQPPRRGGSELPAPRIERVGYVPCLQPSGYFRSEAQPWERHVVRGSGRTDGWRGWWPDYLAPNDGRVALEAGRTQPLWITYRIPKDAAPGEYRGAVTVSGGGVDAVRIPVTLKIWRYTLPDKPTLQVIYDLRNGRGWSLFKTQADWEKWWRFMAQRRVSTDHVRPSPTFRLAAGKVVMETAEFDRAAALCYDELHMSAGYFPPVFYACGWAHPPRNFLGLKYPTPEYQAAYQSAVRQYWEHIKARGWASRLSLYVSDEPHYWSHAEVIEWLGKIIGLTRLVDPSIPVYSSTWGHVPQWDGILNHWGIAQYGRFPMETWRERRAAGDKAWFTTDGQMEIDTPYNACERLLPYYCFAHGVDGYEFWGISWYSYDPYRFGWHKFIYQSSEPGKFYWTRYPNGDGYLAYPGEPLGIDGPVSTIRLEQAREGIEDYEYLVALRELADRSPDAKAQIEALFEKVAALAFIPNRGGYRSTDILPDPDALMALRREAGELLDRLTR